MLYSRYYLCNRNFDCLRNHLRRSLLNIEIFSLFLTKPIPLPDKYLLLNWMIPSSDTDTCNPKPTWLHIQMNNHRIFNDVDPRSRSREIIFHTLRPADPSGRPSRYSSKGISCIPFRLDQSRRQSMNGAVQRPCGRVRRSPHSGHNSHANTYLEKL
jgi:hypothetical protein